MSITDSSGRRSTRRPRAAHAGPVRALEATRRRDDLWLKFLRAGGLTIRALAEAIGQKYQTVYDGIQSATRREEAAEAHRREAEEAGLVAVPGTLLTADDLIYLREEYGPGTELGDDPDVVAFLARPDVAALAGRPAPAAPPVRLLTNTVSRWEPVDAATEVGVAG